MLGYLIPLDKQMFDDDGAPLAGGKLNAYIAGTSTRQAMYTASPIVTPTANPLILDASGRWSAFITDGVAYKFVLTDANDVEIETWDNIEIPEIPVAPATEGVLVGTTVMYVGSVAPTGYLLCDGTAVSRSTYSGLFAIMGTNYGVGNGSTTFNLPDMRQRFALGLAVSGTGATLGATGGLIDHVHTGPSHTHDAGTYTVPSGGAHTHTTGAPNATVTVQAGTGAAPASGTHTHDVASSGAHTHTVTGATGAAGTGNTGTANAPFQVVNFIVKT